MERCDLWPEGSTAPFIYQVRSDEIIREVSCQNYFMLRGHETRLTGASSGSRRNATLRPRLLGTPRRAR